MQLARLYETILDILFPPICASCRAYLRRDEQTRGICDKCLAALPLHNTFFCGTCGARLPLQKKNCHFETPYLLAAACTYDDPHIKQLIHMLKYEKIRACALPLATIIFSYVAQLQYDFSAYVIVPIPLHDNREIERGFNQSLLIGRHLARMMQLPIIENALMRTRATEPQVSLPSFAPTHVGATDGLFANDVGKQKNSRYTNVADCFAVHDATLIAGRDILILDDVTTTGATLAEAARVLRAAGAKKIIGVTAANAH